MENTQNNDIHTNQVLGLSNQGVDYIYLFMSPFFILNKNGFSINRNRMTGNNITEVKLPILSYHLCMHIFIIPFFLFIALLPLYIKVHKEKPEVIHCRNLVSTLLAISCRLLFRMDYKVVCDPRSVYVEECVITHTFKYRGFNYNTWKKDRGIFI